MTDTMQDGGNYIMDKKPIRRIGILTSGGDAPGMNAVIRAVVRTASAHGISVLGIRRGYSGLINGDIVELSARSVDGIIRKGGNEAVLYFGEEVEKALLAYIEGPRVQIAAQALPGEENALFFSLQKKRISVHAVENLVEKYAREFVPQKKITPHKLRSTFGTSLYQETEDIYLVADVLGHSDVGTTRKHYAAIKDQNRRKAARTIKLRDS